MNTFIKSNWKILTFALLFVILGTYARFANLFNVGSLFDLVVTQYDWGKVHAEIGPFRFWQEYDKTLDYMPGAMYIDWGIYLISRLYGGSEQAFVTTMKVFNWIIDILFIWLVYRFSLMNKSFTQSFRLLFVSIIYAIPSVWSVTGLWGQMDTLVASFGILALIFYFYSKEKPEFFVLGNFWLKLHWYFPLIAGIFLAFGYWTKPTGIILLPLIAMLIFHRLDWKGLLQIFAGFIITSIPFAWVPIIANPYKLLYIMTLPLFGFGVNSATRDAANFWLLIDMPWYVGETMLNLGFIRLTIYHFAVIICAGIMGSFLIKYFFTTRNVIPAEVPGSREGQIGFLARFRSSLPLLRAGSETRMTSLLISFFSRKISFFDIALISTLLSYVYFLFYIKMLSRYLMMGILMSWILLALWEKGKRFWTIFTFIIITHFCFALNQIFIVNNDISWVNYFNKTIMPFNYLGFIAAIYLISFIFIAREFWRNEGKDR